MSGDIGTKAKVRKRSPCTDERTTERNTKKASPNGGYDSEIEGAHRSVRRGKQHQAMFRSLNLILAVLGVSQNQNQTKTNQIKTKPTKQTNQNLLALLLTPCFSDDSTAFCFCMFKK